MEITVNSFARNDPQARAFLPIKNIPPVIYVESVKGCPYSCAMCIGRGTKPEKISPKILERIEPFFSQLEVMSIHGFGEPLLADLNYFVTAARSNNFIIHMNTTGFFLDKKKADLLNESKLSIRFSIHAGKKNTYKKIMGQDFDQVKNNIKYLISRSRHIGKNDDFWFSYIVMKENIEEIHEFLELARETGVSNVRFMRLGPSLESVKGIYFKDRDFKFKYIEQFNRVIIEKFRERYESIKDHASKIGIKVEFGTMSGSNFKPEILLDLVNKALKLVFKKNALPLFKNKGFCLAPFLGQQIITQTGNVNLCCGTRYTVGNIFQNTIEEIWKGEKLENIRSEFLNGKIPRVCGYCRGFGLDNYPNNSFKNLREHPI